MAYGPTLKKQRNRPLQIGIIIVGGLLVLCVTGYYVYDKVIKPRLVKDPPAAAAQVSDSAQPEGQVQDNYPSTAPTSSNAPVKSVPAAEQQAVATSVTITSPAANSAVSGGTKLEGSAPAGFSRVSYRLQSDEKGLIGQGDLNVAAGKFSGTVYASQASGAGFIEVFVVDATGKEQGHAKVRVGYR